MCVENANDGETTERRLCKICDRLGRGMKLRDDMVVQRGASGDVSVERVRVGGAVVQRGGGGGGW